MGLSWQIASDPTSAQPVPAGASGFGPLPPLLSRPICPILLASTPGSWPSIRLPDVHRFGGPDSRASVPEAAQRRNTDQVKCRNIHPASCMHWVLPPGASGRCVSVSVCLCKTDKERNQNKTEIWTGVGPGASQGETGCKLWFSLFPLKPPFSNMRSTAPVCLPGRVLKTRWDRNWRAL